MINGLITIANLRENQYTHSPSYKHQTSYFKIARALHVQGHVQPEKNIQQTAKKNRKQARKSQDSSDSLSHFAALAGNDGISQDERPAARDVVSRPQKHKDNFEIYATDSLR